MPLPPSRYPALLLASLLTAPLAAGLSSAHAQDAPWQLCPIPVILSPGEADSLASIPAGFWYGRAEQLDARGDGAIHLQGQVQLEQQGMQLRARLADYDPQADSLQLQGGISLRSAQMRIEGEQGHFRPGQQQGEFSQASFFLADSHSYGEAATLRMLDPQRIELTRLRYSTCPPEQQDWLLSAQRLKLDQQSNTGEAYHATLRFKGVPFFYSPYLNFPLAGRKSGLLPPSFGRSDSNGTELSLPVYWNIAPNRDATLTPRHLSQRGTMLGGEFRFLEQQHAGEVQVGWLGNDRLSGEDRHELGLQHRARFSPGWSSGLHYRGVSDSNYYLDELGMHGHSRHEAHLERRAELRYQDPRWQFLARAQDHQTLLGGAPYQRLPQLQLRGASPHRPQHLHYQLHSEAVSFRHPDSRLPSGERIDLKPAVSLPLAGAAWFLTPSLAWRYTDYRLQNAPTTQQTRSLPIASLDAGLFLERPLSLSSRPYTQTLEPRLFALSVPHREQDALPVFDTAISPFSFASLFRDNRFSGADRQGDAQQITLALSSRLLEDASGRERASIALAQANYLEQRRVTLPGQSADTRRRSDILAELGLSPMDSLNMRLTQQWNPSQQQLEQLSVGVRYRPDQGKLLRANYRYYRPETQRQADLTVLWPLNRQWRILAHHNHDLEYQRSMLNLVGLEYESCCWTTRLAVLARRDTVSSELKHSIMLTLELKGLASLGQSLEQSIGRGILDYD
ncbi:MAG: LPS assembly protein LptD [Gammaproteobacteria bacterium]|nr:LPS assembly protein LptD [Gammaproteobacteria bacterium]